MKRRSPLSHKLSAPAHVNGQAKGYLSALPKADRGMDAESHKQLVLCDLTASYRAGFRGSNIEAWLKNALGILAPPVNRASHTEQGILIIRLSPMEILLQEENPDGHGSIPDLLEKTGTEPVLNNHTAIYDLPRRDSHACFMIRGDCCAQLFSRLCALDLRYHKFLDLHVAQTMMARVSVVIVRRDSAGIPGYFIMADTSLAEYLWDCMVDAMQDFDTRIIGGE